MARRTANQHVQLAVYRQTHADADTHADDFAIDSDTEADTNQHTGQGETLSDSISSSVVLVLGKLAEGVQRLLPLTGTAARGVDAYAEDTGWRQADSGERAAPLVDGLFLLRALTREPADHEVRRRLRKCAPSQTRGCGGAHRSWVRGMQQGGASGEVDRKFVAGAVLSHADRAGVIVDPISCTVAMQISPTASAMVARAPPSAAFAIRPLPRVVHRLACWSACRYTGSV